MEMPQRRNAQRNNNVVPLQQQASITIKCMQPELYRGALSGSSGEIETISDWVCRVTPTGNNVLHVHVGKPLDPKQGINVDFIKRVCHASGYEILRKENDKGDTPLHLAARFGHADAVKVFLDRIKREEPGELRMMLGMTNKDKDTALHEAARGGHTDVVKLLIEADCYILHLPNEVGETPLYLAAERGSTSSVATMLDTCNQGAFALHHKGPCGGTALHAAVRWGDLEMVQKLLLEDSNLIRIQDNTGLSPLHCVAAEIGKSEILKLLLSYDKTICCASTAAVYIRDNNGRTALHIAVLQSNWVAVRDIIDSRPDCVEITDNNGQNVVHYVAKGACYYRFTNFLQLGHFDSLVNEKDVQGNTPLHILAASALDNPGHTCLPMLPGLIKKNPLLDVKLFNKENLTCGDIITSSDSCLRKQIILGSISKQAPRGRRVYNFKEDVDVEKAMTEAESKADAAVEKTKKAGETRLVVAALISTISFTSALTLPGGFNQTPGKDMGMAVLTSNVFFIIFLAFDIMAFSFSTSAIFLHFLLTNAKSTWHSVQRLRYAELLTTLSLGTMGIALTTGVSAAVSRSRALVFVVFAISTVFFISYIPLLLGRFQNAVQWCMGCGLKNKGILPSRPKRCWPLTISALLRPN